MRVLVSVALLAFLGCSREQSRPGSNPDTLRTAPETGMAVAIPAFSGGEAFRYLLNQTAFGPRDPGSTGHQLCLDYLVATLRGFTPDVRLQPFEHTGYGGETLHLTNVIASFRPESAARILLLAHWDTRPRAEHDENKAERNKPILGANDGASGVAVLLEIAAIMKSSPPPIGVDLLFVDGEDYGKEGDDARYLLGSRYFASAKPDTYVPRFGILLDMVGDTNLELPKEQSSVQLAPDVVNLVWTTARNLGITQFVDEPGEQILDDHIPLNEAGIKTIDIIDFNYPDQTNRYWHTHQDTPAHCSAESLGAVGTVLANVIFTQRP